jgi:hypothetical protein
LIEDAMRSMEPSGIHIAALKIPLITITVIGNQYRLTGRARFEAHTRKTIVAI